MLLRYAHNHITLKHVVKVFRKSGQNSNGHSTLPFSRSTNRVDGKINFITYYEYVQITPLTPRKCVIIRFINQSVNILLMLRFSLKLKKKLTVKLILKTFIKKQASLYQGFVQATLS